MGGMAAQVKLDSTHEVPQPNVGSSSPTGTATFTPSGNSISYKLTASGLTSPVTTAHIHVGPPGKAGPVVVPLTISQGSDPSSATGEGSFDESAIKATPDGTKMSWNDLVSGLSNGSLYVNIHTQNNKPGEIRGQIGGQ
jgi:CHRD domain